MQTSFSATRDVIIRTERFDEAVVFYESVFGLKVVHKTESLVGFDAGAFRLFIEAGAGHGPIFEFRVADIQRAKTALLAQQCVVQEEDASIPRCYLRDPYGLVFNIEQGPA